MVRTTDAETEDTQNRSHVPGRWLINGVIVAGCLVVSGALLLPSVRNARDAARRTQSRNNLKQFGLAFHNYHDTWKAFPIGGDIEPTGIPKHGWPTRLVPYLESTTWYSEIDFDRPWAHPINEHRFLQSWHVACIPERQPRYTNHGLALLHYMGNPNVLHRNSMVSLDQMTTGSGHNWLLAEFVGVYQPFGSPFNWRQITWPVNGNPGSFGGWQGGGQICLGDGSVQFLSNDTDPQVIQSFATAPPQASALQTAIPPRIYSTLTSDLEFDTWALKQPASRNTSEPELTCEVRRTADATLYLARFLPRSTTKSISKAGGRSVEASDLIELAIRHPQLHTLVAPDLAVDDDAARAIGRFQQLQCLYVRDLNTTQQGISMLPALKRLVVISGNISSDTARWLQGFHPQCVIEF